MPPYDMLLTDRRSYVMLYYVIPEAPVIEVIEVVPGMYLAEFCKMCGCHVICRLLLGDSVVERNLSRRSMESRVGQECKVGECGGGDHIRTFFKLS